MAQSAARSANPPIKTRVVSLYRLRDDRAFDECWDPPEDEADPDAYTTATVDLADDALLVYGQRTPRPVEWAHMITQLTATPLRFMSAEPSAILFVRLDGHSYALTFGGGWHMLKGSTTDRDFGLEFTLRALDSSEVRKIRRRHFSANARVDTSVVPAGQALWSFGLREHAELVRQVIGKVRSSTRLELSHLHKTNRSSSGVSIDCTERVRLPLPSSPKHLVNDLREVTRVLTKGTIDPDLEPLMYIRRLTADDTAMLGAAWSRLYWLITNYDDKVSLAYPDRYHGGPEITEFTGRIGGCDIRTPELALEHIRNGINSRDASTYRSALKNGWIEGLDEDGTSLGGAVAALHWISAEVDLPSGQRLVLLDGDWYELTDRYHDYVERIVKRAFDQPAEFALPPWNDAHPGSEIRHEEKHYNKYVGTKGGFLCLDRKLIRTRLHKHGFEACDILGPKNELIHVKQASSKTGSGPLSHLFAQGIVAAENLTDRATWDKFVSLVQEHEPARANSLGKRPHRIIYAIHRSDRELRPDTLFTFAKSELASAAITLEKLGIPLHILSIP